MRYRQEGITLIQILIVLMIFGILTSLTLLYTSDLLVRAKETGAQSELDQVQKALWAWMISHDRNQVPAAECVVDFASSDPPLWPQFLAQRYPGGGRAYTWDEQGNVSLCLEESALKSSLEAEYYDNRNLMGDPVITREEEAINYDWGTGRPLPELPKDNFSVRWRLDLNLRQSGVYRFVTRTDDGVRLYVDGNLIIDQWHPMAATSYMADVSLSSGHHQVVMEYFEAGGHAVAQLSWGYLGDSDRAWRAVYYDNTKLQGTPVLMRAEGAFDFRWETGSPGEGVPEKNWSAVWDSSFEIREMGKYRFTVVTDGGIKVLVDGMTVINGWAGEMKGNPISHDVDLLAGEHTIQVFYYHKKGEAFASLDWQKISPSPTSWLGEYYANKELSGEPLFRRYDEAIDFDWGHASPGGDLPSDRFSVRWSKEAKFKKGVYEFTITTDDGMRLYVDGKLLLDAWRDQAAKTYSALLELSEGSHKVVVEFYENHGRAVARAAWKRVADGSDLGSLSDSKRKPPKRPPWVSPFK
ncbi:MAG: hypothetical protein J7M05_11135 [Anaerolineae bacterium]|nr:hypothetical protein [Anaerolineae bacterium]